MADRDRDGVRPSVRIEVDTAVTGAPEPEMLDPSPERSPKRAIAGVIAALALLGTLLFALAPESGETADGTQVSPPTTERTEVDPSTPASVGSTANMAGVPALIQPTNMSELGDAVFPLEAFDSAEPPGSLFDVVELRGEWFAVAFGLPGDPELVRSNDGLNWEAVELAESMTVLGVGLIDGRLVVAVYTSERPVEAQEFFDPARQHRIEFLASSNGVTWEPSLDFGPMVGSGAVYFVAIGSEAVAYPVLRELDEPDIDGLVAFFDGVLSVDRARAVCDADHSTIGGTRVAVLTDCEGKVLGELNEYDAPDLFVQSGYIKSCVADFLRDFQMSEELRIQQRRPEGLAAEPVINAVQYSVGGFGRMFGAAYMSTGFRSGFEGNCTSKGVPSMDWVLARTTAEDGTVFFPQYLPTDGGSGVNSLVRSDSGQAVMVGKTVDGVSISRATAPFDEWSSMLLVDDVELRQALWSATPDARLVFGASNDRWIFVTPEGEMVKELAIIEGKSARVVMVLDDSAIVQLQFERQRLIRVPLSNG